MSIEDRVFVAIMIWVLIGFIGFTYLSCRLNRLEERLKEPKEGKDAD